MDYKTKSLYIENYITPILQPLGFCHETWEEITDGNGWQYTKGNQMIDIYDKFTYIDMRFIANYPIRRVVDAKSLSYKNLHFSDQISCFGYDYKTQDEFKQVILVLRNIILDIGLKKLEELCNPITDENPIRNIEYFNKLEKIREEAILNFPLSNPLNSPRLELTKIELKIQELSSRLFCDVVDDLVNMSAVYGNWIIKYFGGEWKNNNGICEIDNVGTIKATIIPTDDIFKSWSGVEIVSFDRICKKYGNIK